MDKNVKITAVRTPDGTVTLTGYQTEILYTNIDKREVIASGIYENIPYMIINMGTHPCAYIRIPDDSKYAKMEYDCIPLIVHGSLTAKYSGLTIGARSLVLDTYKLVAEGIWIGWDYAHFGDWYGDGIQLDDNRIKWTTDDILDEVFDAIRQFNSLK